MRYQLVVFDMDGTLTEELLDFDVIRAEIGVPAALGILEFLTTLKDEAKATAEAILHEHEITAARNSTLLDGAAEVLASLRAAGVRTALLTRNSVPCTQTVLGKHGLVFEHVSTRADLPYKPHADSILNVVRKLGMKKEQTLMVGDYLYDVQAAANAGVDCALLCVRDGGVKPPYAEQATYCVSSLRELIGVVNS